MSVIVTSKDPKGVHAMSICAAAYDDAKLTESQAHRINMRGDELRRSFDELLANFAVEGRMVRIADKVELLIEHGYHTACGMEADAYRGLWPEAVEQPPEYLSRLDIPLLVDGTITADRLAECNRNTQFWVQPGACENLVPQPMHTEFGAPLTRYVAWIQLSRWINHNVEQACAEMPADEVGLVSAEGLHLPGQCEKHLRKFAVDLPGSRHGAVRAPCVHWFGLARPHFDAHDVRARGPRYGSGSRGIRVVPVSW